MREIKRGLTVQRDTNLVDREVYCAETAERKYPPPAHRQVFIRHPQEYPVVDILIHGPLGECHGECQAVLLDFMQGGFRGISVVRNFSLYVIRQLVVVPQFDVRPGHKKISKNERQKEQKGDKLVRRSATTRHNRKKQLRRNRNMVDLFVTRRNTPSLMYLYTVHLERVTEKVNPSSLILCKAASGEYPLQHTIISYFCYTTPVKLSSYF